MLRFLLSRLAAALPDPEDGVEPDLIDHPVYQGMTPLELADLPFPRHSSRDAEEDAVIASEPLPPEPYETSHAA